MKKIQTITYVLLASFFAMSSARAHDPALHTKKAEKPKCEAMKNMDHSKMDMNDPVMMAMMKKCMSEKPNESNHNDGAVKSAMDNNGKKKADQHGSGHNH